MKESNENMNLPCRHVGRDNSNTPPGYPAYPTCEDIYRKYMDEKNETSENSDEITDSN